MVKRGITRLKSIVAYWVSVDSPQPTDFHALSMFCEAILGIEVSVEEIESIVLKKSKKFLGSPKKISAADKRHMDAFIAHKEFYHRFTSDMASSLDVSSADALLDSMEKIIDLPDIATKSQTTSISAYSNSPFTAADIQTMHSAESLKAREQTLLAKQQVLDQQIISIEDIHVRKVLNELDVRTQNFLAVVHRAQQEQESVQSLEKKKLQLQDQIFQLTEQKVSTQYEIAELHMQLKQLKQFVQIFSHKKKQLETQIEEKLIALDQKLMVMEQKQLTIPTKSATVKPISQTTAQEQSLYSLLHKAQHSSSTDEIIELYKKIQIKYAHLSRDKQLAVRDDIIELFNKIKSYL